MVAWPLAQASISLDSGFPKPDYIPRASGGGVSHAGSGWLSSASTFLAPLSPACMFCDHGVFQMPLAHHHNLKGMVN